MKRNVKVKDRIEGVLDEKLRPLLRTHGGDIEVMAFENGVLKVKMLGSCNNCPSAVSDVEDLAAAEVRAAVPEVERVMLVSGVSDELLETAKALMKMKRQD